MTSTLAGNEAYEFVDAVSEEQLADLMQLYRSTWWAKDRERADVERMLLHVDVIVGICERESRRLVAFARVLTDCAYKAVIFDVIVDPAVRGTGLGRMLVERIVAHPALCDVRHVELYCRPEMVPFYRKFGFSDDLPEVRYMRRVR